MTEPNTLTTPNALIKLSHNWLALRTLLLRALSLSTLLLSTLFFGTVGFSAEIPIQPYQGSSLIQTQKFDATTDYRLPLGGLKRKQGVLQPEDSHKISARKAAFTHEVDRTNLPSEVLDYFLSEFKKQQFQIVFQCRAMACGENSHWANNVFRQRKLNGLGRSQFLFTLKQDSSQDYLVFYLVQRGNKSVFTHLEWFYEVEQEVATVDPLAVYDLLQKQNRVELKNITISSDGSFADGENEAAMASISKLLQDYPHLNLVLVGHDESKATLQKSLEFSTLIAQNAAMAIDGFSKGALLPSYGVGSLAPLHDPLRSEQNPPYWVELVLLP